MLRMIGVIMSLGVDVQFGMIADYDLEDYQTVADEVSEYLSTVYFIVEMVMGFLYIAVQSTSSEILISGSGTHRIYPWCSLVL